jgi:glycosyltransferase EpsD
MTAGSKILFVASTFKHIRAFHRPYISMLKNQGHLVDAAANDIHIEVSETDQNYNLTINRSPFSKSNLKAIIELRKLIRQNAYDLVHCHTAMGSVVARIAALTLKNRPKVIYTAHGFHFFKGGPLRNWLLYFPIEWVLSFWTDTLVVINKEDHTLANRWFHAKRTYKIDGIGVESKKFLAVDIHEKNRLRNLNNIPEDAFVLIYAAEYIPRKNHNFILKAALELKNLIPELLILFAGRGSLLEETKYQIQNFQLEKTIIQLGFVQNIENYFALADLGISASRQEGLGLNLIEEMFCGLPVVASQDRGHKEIVVNDYNGYLFEQNNLNDFISKVSFLYHNPLMVSKFSQNAIASVEKFKIASSLFEMNNIYQST